MCTFYLAFVAITLWSFSTKADVRFVNPAAGATISAGTLNVQWGESGTAPLLSDLASFQLYLMTGGNDADDMLAIANGAASGYFSSGATYSYTIDADWASNLENGFFLKMTSAANQGGTVVNYSDRFTLSGMTGSLQQIYINAVKALGGNTTGPPTVNDVIAFTTATSSSASMTSSTAGSASSTSSTNTIATGTAGPPATSTASTATTIAKHAGLSTGLQAGIGAGVAVCAIGVVALVAFTLIQRRRRRTNRWLGEDISRADQQLPGTAPKKPVAHIECTELGPESEVSEADDAAQLPEMDEKNSKTELEASQSELAGSPVSHELPGWAHEV